MSDTKTNPGNFFEDFTLGQVIAAVCALTDADVEETRARILPAVRELALTGMVAL